MVAIISHFSRFHAPNSKNDSLLFRHVTKVGIGLEKCQPKSSKESYHSYSNNSLFNQVSGLLSRAKYKLYLQKIGNFSILYQCYYEKFSLSKKIERYLSRSFLITKVLLWLIFHAKQQKDFKNPYLIKAQRKKKHSIKNKLRSTKQKNRFS